MSTYYRRRDTPAFLLALMMFALFFSGPAFARSPDETWAAAQTHLGKNAGLTALRIATQFELPGDAGAMSGTYKTIVRRLSPDGDGVRELETETEEARLGLKMAPLDFGLGTNLADQPQRLFTHIDSVQLAGTEPRGGKLWQVLEVRTYLSKGKTPVRARIWVDEQTGHVLEVKGVIENSPLPGVKTVDFAVTYELSGEGLSLPKIVTVAYTISIFFRSGSAKFVHELSGWTRR